MRIRVLSIEATSAGWLIHHDGPGYVLLTPAWAEDLHRHQVAVNRTNVPALNRLRYELAHADPSPERLVALFEEAYSTVIGYRRARLALGLKAVTRDGHADLAAVLAGAPIRDYNRAEDPGRARARMADLIEEVRNGRDR